MKKIFLFLTSLLCLTSCNPVIDVTPLKNKLDEIQEYRKNFRYKKFSVSTAIYASLSYQKTYEVSLEDEFMTYKYESMTQFGENKHLVSQEWVYRKDNEYVVVNYNAGNVFIDKISTKDCTFINLINLYSKPTTLLNTVPLFDKVVENLFFGLKDLIKCVNDEPEQFLREYKFTIDEQKDILEITNNDKTKYIYENNFLTFFEVHNTSGSVTRYYMNQSIDIMYPTYI